MARWPRRRVGLVAAVVGLVVLAVAPPWPAPAPVTSPAGATWSLAALVRSALTPEAAASSYGAYGDGDARDRGRAPGAAAAAWKKALSSSSSSSWRSLAELLERAEAGLDPAACELEAREGQWEMPEDLAAVRHAYALRHGRVRAKLRDGGANRERTVVHSVTYGDRTGGLGDRFNGILTSFVLALLTERAFFIHWDKPVPLTTFLVPAGPINWMIDDRMIAPAHVSAAVYGGPFGLGGYGGGGGGGGGDGADPEHGTGADHDDAASRDAAWAGFAANPHYERIDVIDVCTELAERLRRPVAGDLLAPGAVTALLEINTNCNLVDALFASPLYNGTAAWRALWPAYARGDLYPFVLALFKPSCALAMAVADMEARALAPAAVRIGLHVRTGQRPNFDDPARSRLSTAQQAIAYADQGVRLARALSASPAVAFFVMTDYEPVTAALATALTARLPAARVFTLPVTADLPLTHLDHNDTPEPRDHFRTFLEWYLFRRMDGMVLARSKYSLQASRAACVPAIEVNTETAAGPFASDVLGRGCCMSLASWHGRPPEDLRFCDAAVALATLVDPTTATQSP